MEMDIEKISKSSSKNSSASSKKSSSGESGTTKTKTSVGQAIKNFAEKYASSNWQKNNPDFGIHSSSSSYGNSYTFGESSYSNGTKEASRDSETRGKSSENSIKQTSSSSSQKPKTYNKESFAKKNGEIDVSSVTFTFKKTF